MKYMLNGDWQFSFTEPFEGRLMRSTAPVPGNVEPELVKLGLLEDYYPADNERATVDFEGVDDWTYIRLFDAPKADAGWSRQLVFEGIDTLAEIYLNGQLLGNCSNMHLTYRFDVDALLHEKDNELKVVLRSTELWAREHLHDMYSNPHNVHGYYDSQSYLRKARHEWGWDNAPRLITCGIYRPVYLEYLPPMRFEDVYLYTKSIDEKDVHIGLTWTYKTNVRCFKNHQLHIMLYNANEELVYDATSEAYFVRGLERFSVPRDKIQLWWPSGFGAPNLCRVKLEMLVDGVATAAWESPWGIRTIELDRTDDIMADGSGEMVFKVNGERVFIRGTNWKPLDALHSQAEAKVLRALNEVKELNCNMIRIWGGGIYEDHAFFDYCDRNGIMVWQDFMMACETPPTDEVYCKVMDEEAVYIITKLRNHASLAVWCGDNEDDWNVMWQTKGSNARPSHNQITRKVLREAIIRHDPYRDYVDSSPYISDESYVQECRGGANQTHFIPETHLYPNSVHFFEILRNTKSKFIGETGPIDVNAISSNKRLFEREKARTERLWDTPRIPDRTQSHQNDGYFTVWRTAGKALCEASYGRDFTFAEWPDYVVAVNAMCSEVFKDVIEYSRVARWNKTGVIWWSLLDMWPMLFNYSVIDSDFVRKMPFYWIRQSQQAFALMGVRKEIGGDLAIYAVNDTLETHTVDYTVYAYDGNGNERIAATGTCRQGANSAEVIQRIAERDEQELWMIRWTENGTDSYNHVFTGKAPYKYEAMRCWVQIIADKCGFADELLDLQNL